MPKNTPLQKIDALKKYKKTKIKLIGDSFDDSLNYCNEYINNEYINNKYINNFFFIHPFDDYDIINGQGTIFNEICEEIIPDYIYAPIGGGGLIAGLINSYNNSNIKKYNNFNIKFIGVEPYGASSMYNKINNIKKNKNICNFVDGVSVKNVGDITYNIIKNKINNIYKIDNNELCHELIQLYQKDGIITELAGALSISALKHTNINKLKNKNVVCIISGGNNDINRIPDFIEKEKEYLNNQKFGGNDWFNFIS